MVHQHLVQIDRIDRPTENLLVKLAAMRSCGEALFEVPCDLVWPPAFLGALFGVSNVIF